MFNQQFSQNRFIHKFLSCFIIFAFFTQTILPARLSFAQALPQTVLNLPVPGTLVLPTLNFQPVLMKGLNLTPTDPLDIKFMFDQGQNELSQEELKQEADKVIRYFIAALAVPKESLWVNLSPYERNRIAPQVLGQTEMGRDLLAQDYLLKQLTASLMNPEDALGQKFWTRVYAKAQEQFGTTDVPVNTFNKIWIVPEEAKVYEHRGGVFLVENHLKVMLEEDYLALDANRGRTNHGLGDITEKDMDITSGVSSEIVREILIPEIEREVNEGKLFANLRQIYTAMLLATWYKNSLKEESFGQGYFNQGKIKGVEVDDKEIIQKIYDQYVASFQKGVFDYVKDEYDTASQETVPRKYFSGGAALDRAVLSNDDVSKSEITRTIGQITKLLAVPITVFALDKDGNTQEITDSVKVPNVLEEFEDSTNNLININQDTIKHKLDSVGVVPDTDNFPFVVFPKIKLDNNEAMFILQIGDKNKEYMLLTGDEKENDFENLEMKSLTIDGKKIGDIQFEQRYRLLNDQKLFPGTQFVLKNANDTSRFYIFNEDGEGKEITKAELKRNIENWSREKKRVAEQLSFDRDSTQNKKAVNKQLIVDFSSSGQLGYFNELNLSGPFTFNNMFKVIPYIGFGSTKEFGGDRPHIKATGEIELNLENFYGQLGLNFVKGFYLDQGNNEPYYKEGKSFEVLVGPKFSFNKKDGPGSLFTYAGYKEGIIKQYADWYRGELERKKRWAVGIDAHQYKDKKEFTQGMIEFFSNDNPYSQFLTNMGVNVNYSHTDFFGDNSLQFGINSRISADESFGTIMAKLQLNKFGFDIKPTIASRFDRLDYGVDGNMEFYLPITDLMMQFGIAGGWSKDLGGHIAFNILGLAKGKYGTGLPGISRADITVSNQRNIKNSYGYVGATSYVFGYRNPVRPEFSSIYLDNFNVFFPETAANLRFLTLDNYLKSLNFSIKQGDKLLEEINEFENEGEGGGIKELSIGEQKLSKLLELKMEVYKADFQADWENMREETLFIEILNGSPRAHKAYENLKKDTDKLLVPEVIRNKISEKSRKADRAKGADKAMLNNPGGIDLNPEIGTVSVDSDQKFEWNIDPNYRPLDNIPMDGLMHQIIIINPVPLQTIPLMLGLSTEDDQEPAQVVSAQLSMN